MRVAVGGLLGLLFGLSLCALEVPARKPVALHTSLNEDCVSVASLYHLHAYAVRKALEEGADLREVAVIIKYIEGCADARDEYLQRKVWEENTQ